MRHFFGQAGMLEDATIKMIIMHLWGSEYDFLKKKYQLSNMNPAAWKFSKMRPSNFPTVRIAAAFGCDDSSKTNILNHFTDWKQKRYHRIIYCVHPRILGWSLHIWKQSKHVKKGFSDDFIDILIIKCHCPYCFYYGKCIQDESFVRESMQLLEEIKAENNDIIRMFAELDIPQKCLWHPISLLKNTYCHFKRCLSCTIGHLNHEGIR